MGFAALNPSYKLLTSALQRASENGACGALVERDRIAAGSRIGGRHGDDAVDVAVIDAQAAKRVRNADLGAQREHEVEKGAKARLETEIGGEAPDLFLDGLAVERKHIRREYRVGEPV